MEEWAEKVMKEWSRKDTEAAATQHAIAAAQDAPSACTTSSVTMGIRTTMPIELPDQVELMTPYLLTVRGEGCERFFLSFYRFSTPPTFRLRLSCLNIAVRCVGFVRIFRM